MGRQRERERHRRDAHVYYACVDIYIVMRIGLHRTCAAHRWRALAEAVLLSTDTSTGNLVTLPNQKFLYIGNKKRAFSHLHPRNRHSVGDADGSCVKVRQWGGNDADLAFEVGVRGTDALVLVTTHLDSVAERILFFYYEYLGACRRPTPTAWADQKVLRSRTLSRPS